MIYVDISVEDWLKRHAGLEILTLKCSNCSAEMRSTRPFIARGYAGLESPPCSCGKNNHKCSSRITTSPETYSRWANSISKFIGEGVIV